MHACSAASTSRQRLRGTVWVLVEREEGGRSTGRARTGQLVHFNATGGVGELVEVTIDRVTPWSLQGRLAGDLTLAVV